jgi:predicted permease
MIDQIGQDLRFAFRGLRRQRAFTVISALTIAVGIGATTTVLAIADTVLRSAPPVPDADRLVSIWELRRGLASESIEGRLLPFARYEAYEEATRDVFDGLAAHAYADFALRTQSGAIALDGFLTSPNYFEVLRVQPATGRLYTADERVVVLSARLWRARFGSDPGLVGSTVYVDSQPFVVAGIAPAGFTGTMFGVGGDAWIPAAAYREATGRSGATFGGQTTLVVPIGRLAGGVDPEIAAERVASVARAIPPEDPQVTVQGARLDPIAWRGDLLAGVKTFIGILIGGAVMLLLIACANIAGMILARAVGRGREIAIRLAIGVGRVRLVRQLLTESLLLFLIGGTGGVLLAIAATRALSRIDVPVSATIDLNVSPDPAIIAIGIAVAALTGIVFALGPALRMSAVDLTRSLKHGGLAGTRFQRSRTLFVAGQFAMSVVLLVVAGLFLRSLRAGFRVDLAFDPENVVVATIGLDAHGYDEDRGRQFQAALLDRIRTSPDVESAALARLVMLGGMAEGSSVRAAEWDPAERPGLSSRRNVVDHSYFTTMRVPLVAGRSFSSSDVAGSTPVAVINERLASQLWPGEAAVGRRIRTDGTVYEVVGVAADGRYTFLTEEHAFIYTSMEQAWSPLASVHVRSNGNRAGVAAAMVQAANALDPNVAVEDFRLMTEVVDLSLFPQRFAWALTGIFAAIGIVLALIGIYGVLALYVAQRTREFGIRIALGASTGDVLRLVVRRGLLLAVAGSAAGLLLAVAATGALRSFLFGVSPLDPLTFGAVTALMLAIALLACTVPARRATRADPLDALREE